MFQVNFPSGRKVVPALIVVDMQNGFVSKSGSYDKLGMNTSNYRKIIPKLKDLIEFCRRWKYKYAQWCRPHGDGQHSNLLFALF